jgi:hypothetical protein
MGKKYISFYATAGYPAGDRIRYECGICGDALPSTPQFAAACKCRNIIVDSDAGRVAVKNISKFKVYEID